MTSRLRRLAALGLLILATCASREALWRTEVRPLEISFPDEILGLAVTREDVSETIASDRGAHYVDEAALFGLRKGESLQATLQVSKLGSRARPEQEEFRRSMVALMGSTTPQALKLGEERVFRTTGNQQHVFGWFRAKGFFVLTVHRDYPRPRELVRTVVELGLSP